LTYNFDPDRWLDNELAALEAAYVSGRMNSSEHEKRQAEILQRYDAMVARLDGTYQIMKDVAHWKKFDKNQ